MLKPRATMRSQAMKKLLRGHCLGVATQRFMRNLGAAAEEEVMLGVVAPWWTPAMF
jgi:hypothetical protein